MISLLLALLFLALIVVPLAEMFADLATSANAMGAGDIVRIVTNPDLLRVLGNTVAALGISGGLAMAIAVVFAWLNERTDASIGWVARVLPFVPLLLPPIALSTGWFFLAHVRAGILNILIRDVAQSVGISIWTRSGPLDIATWPGLVFVYTMYLVPSAYLLMAAAFQSMDSALEEACRAAGAGTWRTFWHVSLPSIRPSIVAAALLVAIIGLSQFSIPATIGTSARIDILAVRIVNLVRQYPPETERAIVISGFVMAVVAGLWLLQRAVSARQQHAVIGGKGGRANVVRLGAWRWPARVAMIGYLAVTSVLPLLALLFVSLQKFWQPNLNLARLSLDNFRALFLGTAMGGRALSNSVILGCVGATLGILLATVLVVFARQNRGNVLGRLVDGATKAPGAIPHIVIGLAFVMALSGPPFNLGGTLVLLLLAYIVIYMPQAAISVGAGLDQIGPELSEASAVFGASKLRTFWRITLPLLRPSLAAGWVLLFVVMLGDLTASALIAQGSNPVVGFVIYDIWANGTFAQLATLATAVGAVSFCFVGGVLVFSRSRGD